MRPGLRTAQVVAARVSSLNLRGLLVLTGVVALAVRLPWIVGPVNGRIASDSGVYAGMARDLLHGRGFETGTEVRTPAYPVLIALLSLLPGNDSGTVVAAQHLLGVLFTVGLVWAAWRWFGRGAAIGTAIVAACSPVLVNLEGDILPDFVFGVVIAAGALALARAVGRDEASTTWLATAGVLFGIAALVKPAGQALLLTALVPALLYFRRPRRALKGAAILAGCLLLTISPWLVRNAVRYGDVRLSVQDGPALWMRLFDWDQRPIPVTTREDRLAKRIFDATVGKSEYTKPTNTYEYVAADLMTKYGYSQRDAMVLQRHVALEAIAAAPVSYVKGTYGIAKQLTSYTHNLYPARVGINEKLAAADPTLPATPSLKAFGLAQRVVGYWWILSLGLFSTLLLPFVGSRRQRAAALSLLISWLAITLATSLSTWPDPRYAAQNVPLLWVLGSAGAALVVNAVVARIRVARHDEPAA
jgi:4-amino-4-deoxy-L-arabinose transferase-like glycosyltransferase